MILLSSWYMGIPMRQASGSISSHIQSFKRHRPSIIPNIVHYVHVVGDADGDITFELRHFIAVYSVLLYYSPEVIYIHTDASKSAIANALGAQSTVPCIWTHRIFKLPRVVVKQIEIPKFTNTGTKLRRIEHRSDFVRPEILYKHGGIYFDFDVFPIRDIESLRKSGFANIFGLEPPDSINNGVMLSEKNSELMGLFNKYQHIEYDGRWASHSCVLLNKLAKKLVAIPREVLILPRNTFAPNTWRPADVASFFGETGVKEQATMNEEPVDARSHRSAEGSYEDFYQSNSTEADYPETYAIHAYKIGSLEPPVSLPYLLARESKFAKVVYPVVKHALGAGLISE